MYAMARRSTLTRERVLRAALALADKKGIAELTMRRLGQAVGVEAMSLYNHVANKDDLLDLLVDIVFSEIEVQCQDGGWKKAMRRRAVSARQALERHPWAIGLMESRRNPGPANLQHHESVLRCLREAGLSIAMAAHAYSALDSYIYGFALNQQSLPFDTGEEAAKVAGAILEQMKGAGYPRMAEIALEHVMKPDYSYAAEFEFGLDLLLDGLEQRLRRVIKPPTAPPQARARRRRQGARVG